VPKKQFTSYAKYYDKFYSEQKYLEESNFILNYLKKNKINTEEILDLGSGSCRHSSYFLKSGFKVTAVEKSKKMLSLVKKNKNLALVNKDIYQLNLNKKFDCIISLFHVVNYLKDLNLFFSTLSKHSKKNTIVLFDLWFDKSLKYRDKYSCRVIDEKNEDIFRIGVIKIIKNKYVNILYNFFIRNKLNNKINHFQEDHFLNMHSIKKIKDFAKKYNFNVLKVFGNFEKKKINKDTFNILLILKHN
jgi:SAM-dependent methyltransferase